MPRSVFRRNLVLGILHRRDLDTPAERRLHFLNARLDPNRQRIGDTLAQHPLLPFENHPGSHIKAENLQFSRTIHLEDLLVGPRFFVPHPPPP